MALCATQLRATSSIRRPHPHLDSPSPPRCRPFSQINTCLRTRWPASVQRKGSCLIRARSPSPNQIHLMLPQPTHPYREPEQRLARLSSPLPNAPRPHTRSQHQLHPSTLPTPAQRRPQQQQAHRTHLIPTFLHHTTSATRCNFRCTVLRFRYPILLRTTVSLPISLRPFQYRLRTVKRMQPLCQCRNRQLRISRKASPSTRTSLCLRN